VQQVLSALKSMEGRCTSICTHVSRWSNISMRRGGGGGGFLLEKKSDFKTICFEKNQKILRRNSKRKLQNMIKKMTRTKLEIFC